VRSLKAALVGLLGGVLLTTAVLTVEVVHAQRSVSSQMANCYTSVGSDRSTTVCDAATEVGGLEVPVVFVLGFAAAFMWFLRRQRLVSP
jgi:hypothetical protein